MSQRTEPARVERTACPSCVGTDGEHRAYCPVAVPALGGALPVHDPVTRPSHYVTDGGIEAVDVLEAFAADNAHRSHALKYLLRAGRKQGADVVEDLAKAAWWIDREIRVRLGRSR